MTGTTLQNVQILALLQEGKHGEAFNLLADLYQEKVYHLCFAFLRDEALAKDIAQDSLMRVGKALPQYRLPAEALFPWICKIARNCCQSARKWRSRFTSLNDPHLKDNMEQIPYDGEDQEIPRALVKELLAELPEPSLSVLTLYYFQERSVIEVAVMLGYPEGTVKSILSRARGALREQLHRRGLLNPKFWLETSR